MVTQQMHQPRYYDHDDVRIGPLFTDAETARGWVDATTKVDGGDPLNWSIEPVEVYPTGTRFAVEYTATGQIEYLLRDSDYGRLMVYSAGPEAPRVSRVHYQGLERADGRLWSSYIDCEVVVAADLAEPALVPAHPNFSTPSVHGGVVSKVFVARGGSDPEALLDLIDTEADRWTALLSEPRAFEHYVAHGALPDAVGDRTAS